MKSDDLSKVLNPAGVDLPPGRVLGHYRIRSLLGRGGMGCVYEVEHLELGSRYAMKAFVPGRAHSAATDERFLAESRLLARLDHPNLVKVFDLGRDPVTGILYYVMNLVLDKAGRGRNLGDLAREGADENTIAEWFAQLGDALDYIHDNGVVHRDIKLENILVSSSAHVLLSDFGISKVLRDAFRFDAVARTLTLPVTEEGKDVIGTIGYLAPELLAGGEAAAASDHYAFGVAMFRLLTGLWYEPSLEPRKGNARVDAAKLLEGFELPWAEALLPLLAEDPAARPRRIGPLVGRLKQSRGRSSARGNRAFWRLFRLVAASALAALVLAVLAVALMTRLGLLPTVPESSRDSEMARDSETAPEAEMVPAAKPEPKAEPEHELSSQSVEAKPQRASQAHPITDEQTKRIIYMSTDLPLRMR